MSSQVFKLYNTSDNTSNVSTITTIDNIHTILESISLKKTTQEILTATLNKIVGLIDVNSPSIVSDSSIASFQETDPKIPNKISALEGMRNNIFDIERRFFELFGKRKGTDLLTNIDVW